MLSKALALLLIIKVFNAESSPFKNADVCEQNLHLFSFNGKYLKTACFVKSVALTYSEASRKCSGFGMKLLEISSPELEHAFRKPSLNSQTFAGLAWVDTKISRRCIALDCTNYIYTSADCNHKAKFYCEYSDPDAEERKWTNRIYCQFETQR